LIKQTRNEVLSTVCINFPLLRFHLSIGNMANLLYAISEHRRCLNSEGAQ
jgi:hypothetical protein